jgi:hypothetical protein
MSGLVLKRASASRPSGEWNDDDFDVLADGAVVGRIFKANASPVGSPWMWTLIFDITKTARRRMATRRGARPRWRLRKASGDNRGYAAIDADAVIAMRGAVRR